MYSGECRYQVTRASVKPPFLLPFIHYVECSLYSWIYHSGLHTQISLSTCFHSHSYIDIIISCIVVNVGTRWQELQSSHHFCCHSFNMLNVAYILEYTTLVYIHGLVYPLFFILTSILIVYFHVKCWMYVPDRSFSQTTICAGIHSICWM